MSEAWAGNYFIRFINLNTYRIMSNNHILTLAEDLQWRVIGNWSAVENGEPKNGAINYGFSSQESALSYIANLLNIATCNNLNAKCTFGHLQVSAPLWCGMEDFKGSYHVASYIN